MPFATAFFDGDNTTIVLTKDYINCERNFFIIFDGDCLMHADPRQPSMMLPTLKWIHEMRRRAVPFPDLAKAFFDGDDERVLWSLTVTCFHILIVVSEHFMDMGFY